MTPFAPACRVWWRRFYSSRPHCKCGAMLNVDLFLTQNNATLWERSVKPVSVTASVCETVKQVGGLRECLISPSTRNKPNILSRWRIILVQYFGWWLPLYDIFIFRFDTEVYNFSVTYSNWWDYRKMPKKPHLILVFRNDVMMKKIRIIWCSSIHPVFHTCLLKLLQIVHSSITLHCLTYSPK